MQTLLDRPVTSKPDHQLPSNGNETPTDIVSDQSFEQAIIEGRAAADADRQDAIADGLAAQPLPEPDFENMAEASEAANMADETARNDALSKGLEQAGLGVSANPATPEQQAVGHAVVAQSVEQPNK